MTGRSFSELGFDIRNLNVDHYQDEKDLTKRILKYCKLFFRIKRLKLSSKNEPLYSRGPSLVKLEAPKKGADLHLIREPKFKMRDGAIRVGFQFVKANSEADWFGVYFRVGKHPFWGSHLLYVRQDGRIEIGEYPGPRILDVCDAHGPINGRHALTVEFENNHLHARLGDANLQVDFLSLQTVGGVWLGAWNADVNVDSVEVICRDTIDWD